jgi:hypothetical protein
MAQIYKVNPPIDGNSVAVFGKNVDYVEINFGNGTIPATGNILSSWNLGPNGAWPVIIQTVEQVASIEVLGAIQANCILLSQFGGNANIGVRMLTTGVNAANATSLQNAIQALGTISTGNGSTSAPYSNVNVAAVTVSAISIGNPQPGPLGGQNSGFPAGVSF